jgi:hypothetical protein
VPLPAQVMARTSMATRQTSAASCRLMGFCPGLEKGGGGWFVEKRRKGVGFGCSCWLLKRGAWWPEDGWEGRRGASGFTIARYRMIPHV